MIIIVQEMYLLYELLLLLLLLLVPEEEETLKEFDFAFRGQCTTCDKPNYCAGLLLRIVISP